MLGINHNKIHLYLTPMVKEYEKLGDAAGNV